MSKPIDIKARPREQKRLRNLAPMLTCADQRVAKPPEKEAESFYLSKEWRDTVADLKRERGIRCEKCGIVAGPDGQPIRLAADHIIERKDGGADLDKANLQLLCYRCHAQKTANARVQRWQRPLPPPR